MSLMYSLHTCVAFIEDSRGVLKSQVFEFFDAIFCLNFGRFFKKSLNYT